MGQLWNRIRKIAQSYTRDTPSWSYESIEEEDQQRLKEIIDELNRQGPSHQQNEARNNAGQSGSQSGNTNRNSDNRSKSNDNQKQQQRPGAQTPEAALATLGLPAKATGEEIKRAYKRLMLKYHPDRVATLSLGEQEAAHRRAQEINAAYQTLKVRYSL